MARMTEARNLEFIFYSLPGRYSILRMHKMRNSKYTRPIWILQSMCNWRDCTTTSCLDTCNWLLMAKKKQRWLLQILLLLKLTWLLDFYWVIARSSTTEKIVEITLFTKISSLFFQKCKFSEKYKFRTFVKMEISNILSMVDELTTRTITAANISLKINTPVECNQVQ